MIEQNRAVYMATFDTIVKVSSMLFYGYSYLVTAFVCACVYTVFVCTIFYHDDMVHLLTTINLFQ